MTNECQLTKMTVELMDVGLSVQYSGSIFIRIGVRFGDESIPGQHGLHTERKCVRRVTTRRRDCGHFDQC
jgi:hypothetical protein